MPATTIAAFRTAAEQGDGDAVAALLAPGVVLHSPLSARVRFEGRDEVAALHRDIFAVLEGLETAKPLTRDDTLAITFTARVRGADLEAVVLVHCDTTGQIDELTIYGRPLPAVAALFAALPPRVSARRHNRATGALVAAVARPVAFVLRVGDRLAPRLI